MQENNTLIRETKSLCPECLRLIKADILEIENKVYIAKQCPQHGKYQLLLSNHPWYYRQLNDFYFSLITESFPQRDYIVHLTNRCNLNCPICLADSNLRHTKDYSQDAIKEFLRGKRNFKIDLMGAEPTMRRDLPEIIRMVKKSGNIAALHTNGIKIDDFSYLRQLRSAGLDEVHFQFDGFDDQVYEKIRGRRLLQTKLKALENLEKLNIATDLKATIVRGINESQMIRILDFAVKHSFVKGTFFLGCRYLGRAKDLPIEGCIMPDELIDILQEQTNGKISRENIFRFQKLYFALLATFSKRKCFYVQHFFITRHKRSYLTIDEIFDLKNIQGTLDKLKNSKLKNKKISFLTLLFSLISHARGWRGVLFLMNLFPTVISFIQGFTFSKLPKKHLLLGFISACDVHSFDYQIARNCGKGAVSAELGIQDVGALDNVLRDQALASANLERECNEDSCSNK
jgi:uncharacterized radical SAM superfamily Fe-S cluster-containing enzyme